MRDRLHVAALLVVLVSIVVSTWFPFELDLPRRVQNTAVQRADGAWEIDRHSRIVSHGPISTAMSPGATRLGLSIEAIATSSGQVGPARLLSAGRHPYEAGFMVGIDRNHLIVYLHCAGGADNVDAAWTVPLEGQRLAVQLWIDLGRSDGVVSMQVNDQPTIDMASRCPAGTVPALPDVNAPWALGNVYSGHRPFVGRIDKLEAEVDGRKHDLLRATAWEVPATFWLWPERFYQPANDISTEILSAVWHLASFAILGCLMGRVSRRVPTRQLVMAAFLFAVVLNGGKGLIAGRHPSAIDLLLNLVGVFTCLQLRRRSAGTGAVAASRDSARATARQ
jgi:hypothetical protein